MKVVILSYNHVELTKACIESCGKLYPERDILLVHNGSDCKNIDALQNQFPNLTHYILVENRGYSGGTNFGLSMAFLKSEWALFLSNDCELINVDQLPTQPGLYAPLVYRRNSGKVDSIGAAFNTKTGKLRHFHTDLDQLKANEKFYVPGSAFLMHKQIFEEVGGFNEKLGTYWEDVELSLRLQRKNLKLGTASAFQVKHKIGKTCHKDPHYTSYLYNRNRMIVCRSQTEKNNFGKLQQEAQFCLQTAKQVGSHYLRGRNKHAWLNLKSYRDSFL